MIGVIATLILSIFLETNYISIPITFASLVFWTVVMQRNSLFIVAFFAGIFLDGLTFNFLGISSAFFLLSIFAIFLYRSKFEIKTIGFAGSFCFFGSIIFMILKGSGDILLGSFLTTLFFMISFKFYQIYGLRINN